MSELFRSTTDSNFSCFTRPDWIISTCGCVKLVPDSCLHRTVSASSPRWFFLRILSDRHSCAFIYLFHSFSSLLFTSLFSPSRLTGPTISLTHAERNITCPTPRCMSYSQITERSGVQERKKRVRVTDDKIQKNCWYYGNCKIRRAVDVWTPACWHCSTLTVRENGKYFKLMRTSGSAWVVSWSRVRKGAIKGRKCNFLKFNLLF